MYRCVSTGWRRLGPAIPKSAVYNNADSPLMFRLPGSIPAVGASSPCCAQRLSAAREMSAYAVDKIITVALDEMAGHRRKAAKGADSGI